MSKQSTASRFGSSTVWEELESLARVQIQSFLQGLLEEEIMGLVGRPKSARRGAVDSPAVYRNGHGRPRQVSMSCGTITVQRPRVRGLEERFESQVLPLFARRTKQVGELLPTLYLHGLAQGDFELALRGLLGDGAPLSASSIARLRERWQQEYAAWRERSLIGLEPVYLWADGIYLKAGLEKDKAALLVVIAALRDGRKVIVALESGYRESAESWGAVLRSLRERGLPVPRLVVADGHLGIWKALTEVFPEAAEQRCWNHKIRNVLTRLPKRLQAEAKAILLPMPYAETRALAVAARERFRARFAAEHPQAVEALERDWDRLVAFYDFPKEHWKHLRTTNPVESPFAAVRLRTDAAKRFKKVQGATALVWRLLLVAEKNFRRLDHPELLPEVALGARFENGIRVKPSPDQEKLETAA